MKTAVKLTISEIIKNWDTVSSPGLCSYCEDFTAVVMLPFPRGKPACKKCFSAMCYGM